MIEFEMPDSITKQVTMLTTVAENMMRPVARQLDENEHEIPWDFINFMHTAMTAMGGGRLTPAEGKKREGPRIGYQRLAYMIEILSWGDAGIYLNTPGPGLGGAALEATGRKTVLLAGIEAHICIYQTAAGLVEKGYHVEVVADAVSSRTLRNSVAGLEKAVAAGAIKTAVEIAVMELMQTAEHPGFRNVLKVIK